MLAMFSAEEKKSFETFSKNAEMRLMSHNWPGNVRELGNVIQSTVVLNDGPELTANMLRPILGAFPEQTHTNSNTPALTSPHHNNDVAQNDSDTIEPYAITERRIIENAIALCGGKVRKAAKALKVNPSTLYRKLERWQTTHNE